jgi:hypothetical protein
MKHKTASTWPQKDAFVDENDPFEQKHAPEHHKISSCILQSLTEYFDAKSCHIM